MCLSLQQGEAQNDDVKMCLSTLKSHHTYTRTGRMTSPPKGTCFTTSPFWWKVLEKKATSWADHCPENSIHRDKGPSTHGWQPHGHWPDSTKKQGQGRARSRLNSLPKKQNHSLPTPIPSWPPPSNWKNWVYLTLNNQVARLNTYTHTPPLHYSIS